MRWTKHVTEHYAAPERALNWPATIARERQRQLSARVGSNRDQDPPRRTPPFIRLSGLGPSA